jgi:transcriptional regulator with GAF, ATPase, and Fis domain
MAGIRRWEQLAKDLAEMARDLLSKESTEATLEAIVQHAVKLVDGCDAAGIMRVRHGRVATLAATDDMVRASDRLQEQVGEGPCFDAQRNKHEVYRIPDMADTVRRWNRYAPRASKLGIGSMMGFLLYTRSRDDLGALDLYSARQDTFTEDSECTGWLLASHAAVALASAQRDEQLHEALKTRQAIGAATGILMARYKLTEQEAFGRIVRTSQHQNVKIRELANTINTTGELPESR